MCLNFNLPNFPPISILTKKKIYIVSTTHGRACSVILIFILYTERQDSKVIIYLYMYYIYMDKTTISITLSHDDDKVRIK